jgi:PLP dependent protein
MNLIKNKETILDHIETVCKRTGRDPGKIHLLAVTKTRLVEEIETALKAGISLIGENKVQEAEQKLPLIKGSYSEFHFIGHLQTNKVKKLLTLKPALIHSIDSIRTLKKINDLLAGTDRKQKVLIQVNTSGEISKSGIQPAELQEFLNRSQSFSNIRIRGLMTIGTFTSDQVLIRSCFKKLNELFNEVRSMKLENCKMQYLSMGMSGDYEIAIEEGGNILRIGSALFGPRYY